MSQEKTKITFGRHKGKTFAYVYENDLNYCRMLVEHPRQNSRHGGNSDDFISYVNSMLNIAGEPNDFQRTVDEVSDSQRTVDEANDSQKTRTFTNSRYCRKNRPFSNRCKSFYDQRKKPPNPKPCDIIDDHTVTGFIKLFKYDHIREMKYIISASQIPINLKIVHEKSKVEGTNGMYGYFLMYFVGKIISDIKQELPAIEAEAAEWNYFPILLNWTHIDQEEDFDILNNIDETIVQEIKDYLNEYYINLEDCEKELKCMIRLINMDKNSKCGDLYSLLDTTFFLTNRAKYMETLKKYMFFYSNCLEKYKEGFENCVKIKKISNRFWKLGQSWKKYIYYKGDVINIVNDILVVARDTYREKFGDFDENKLLEIDIDLFRAVKNYIENIPNINKCICDPYTQMSDYMPNSSVINETEMEEEITQICGQIRKLFSSVDGTDDEKLKIFEQVDGAFLFGTPDICLGNQIIDVCYSSRCKNDIRQFFKLFLYSSLLRKKYERFVIYNAYRGEEISIDVMLEKEIIKNFIRKYRSPLSIINFAQENLRAMKEKENSGEGEETDESDEEMKADGKGEIKDESDEVIKAEDKREIDEEFRTEGKIEIKDEINKKLEGTYLN